MGFWWTHVVRNLRAVVGETDAVATHLHDNVLSEDLNLLGAVLDPEGGGGGQGQNKDSDGSKGSAGDICAFPPWQRTS